MENRVRELEKRIADLEDQVQNQQKDFSEALAFLFDRSEYKVLIKEGKLNWPKMLTESLKLLGATLEAPIQEQLNQKRKG